MLNSLCMHAFSPALRPSVESAQVSKKKRKSYCCLWDGGGISEMSGKCKSTFDYTHFFLFYLHSLLLLNAVLLTPNWIDFIAIILIVWWLCFSTDDFNRKFFNRPVRQPVWLKKTYPLLRFISLNGQCFASLSVSVCECFFLHSFVDV